MTRASGPSRPFTLFAAVTLSGAAGLTWEVMWQHHATLALGASAFGVRNTELLAAGLDVAVGIWAIGCTKPEAARASHEGPSTRPPVGALVLSALSGTSVFVLEVSWFRSIRAAYESTTESFAIVLAAFLGSLALGAAFAVPLQKRFPFALPQVPTLAAVGVLCATPFVDQLDRSTPTHGGDLAPARPPRHGLHDPRATRDDPGARLPLAARTIRPRRPYRQSLCCKHAGRRHRGRRRRLRAPPPDRGDLHELARRRALRPRSRRSRSTEARRANACRGSAPTRISDRCSTSRRVPTRPYG